MDEVNFIQPSVIGALNTVLDGGPLLITETSEVIVPHENFRIVATGNAMNHGDDSSLYRGIQRMNLALIQRFLTLQVDYMTPLEEAVMLKKVAPALPSKVISVLVEVAEDVRAAFKKGDIESTISTRTLVKLANILQARLSLLVSNPEEELLFALKFTLTEGLRIEDGMAIEGTLNRRSYGLNIAQTEEVNARDEQPQDATNKVTTTYHCAIDPSKNGESVFWIGVEGQTGGDGFTMTGAFSPGSQIKGRRVTRGKDKAALITTRNRKINGGYSLYFSGEISYADSGATLAEAVLRVSLAFATNQGSEIVCSGQEACGVAQAITDKMGFNYTFKV